MKGKLIIFSAPSGAGKTTIVRQLLERGLNLEFSVSATSRLPRPNELHGRDYYFLTLDEFKTRVAAGDFLEWEEVYSGIRYGTLKSEVDRICDAGKNVIFDVDVVGGLNIKTQFGEQALAIFVQPPSVEELLTRLKNRSTESEEKIAMRIAKAEHELSFAPQFDVIVVNDNLDKAVNEAEKLVRNFIS
ncbi:MAG TPA: guanylate kinase [Prolixibacteraceae bacterium]|nr:guanylate kinase [Prolixibacteraceae bacterium]